MRAMVLTEQRKPLHMTDMPEPLEKANEALDDLRAGRFEGAAVVVVDPDSSGA